MEVSKTPERATPHVLVLPHPTQGHINPMLQFAKRLVSKGVRATLVLTVHILRSVHAELTGPIGIETISDGYDEGGLSQAGSAEAHQASFMAVGSETLSSLIRRLDESGKPVDAVVYDAFMPWGLDVAKELRKLGAAFFTQNCVVNNIYYHVKKGLVELPLKGPRVSFPGLPPLEPSETPSFIQNPGSYPASYDMVVDQFRNVEKADFVLVNTFYELEKELADWTSTNLWPLKTIGPTVPSVYLDKRLSDDKDYTLNLFKPNNEACTRWLGRKPPQSVVYVSFGSMAQLTAGQMAEIAAALSECRHSFLWIVRESEMSKLPAQFLDATAAGHGDGLVLTWCSQLEVLNHDSIGCFITHCGWNSILEAISLGVPLVAVPQWTDQPTNAKCVEDVWEIGVRARPGKEGVVGREQLGLCIEKVMKGEEAKAIRENAMKWKGMAKEAVDAGGSTDMNIDEFVAKLSSSRSD